MADWIHLALQPHFHLSWNLFLALAPLGLAWWLFRRTERRGWLWWPLLVAFILFLPNAAYTLTDIIHFIDEVRYSEPQLPEWSVAYIVIPKYTLLRFSRLSISRHFSDPHGRLHALGSSPQMGGSRRIGAEFSLFRRRLLGTLFTSQ